MLNVIIGNIEIRNDHLCTGWTKQKGRSQNIIVFHELLSLGCINLKNLGAHHQEEVLRFPKHPQLAKFALF